MYQNLQGQHISLKPYRFHCHVKNRGFDYFVNTFYLLLSHILLWNTEPYTPQINPRKKDFPTGRSVTLQEGASPYRKVHSITGRCVLPKGERFLSRKMCSPTGKRIPAQDSSFPPRKVDFSQTHLPVWELFFLLGKSNFCREMHLPVGEWSFLWGKYTCLWGNTSSSREYNFLLGNDHLMTKCNSLVGAVTFLCSNSFSFGKYIFLSGSPFLLQGLHIFLLGKPTFL